MALPARKFFPFFFFPYNFSPVMAKLRLFCFPSIKIIKYRLNSVLKLFSKKTYNHFSFFFFFSVSGLSKSLNSSSSSKKVLSMSLAYSVFCFWHSSSFFRNVKDNLEIFFFGFFSDCDADGQPGLLWPLWGLRGAGKEGLVLLLSAEAHRLVVMMGLVSSVRKSVGDSIFGGVLSEESSWLWDSGTVNIGEVGTRVMSKFVSGTKKERCSCFNSNFIFFSASDSLSSDSLLRRPSLSLIRNVNISIRANATISNLQLVFVF